MPASRGRARGDMPSGEELVRLLRRQHPAVERPTDASLPACPVCRASAYRIGQGDAWTHPDQLEHDCSCCVEHAGEHATGVRLLWTARMHRVNFEAMVPSEYRELDFGGFVVAPGNREAYQAARGLRLGESLYLWGLAGNGKTRLAVAAARALAGRHSARFWNASSLLAHMKSLFGTDQDMPRLVEPDVLVLDDLGKFKPGEWAYGEVYRALEERVSGGKTTICTANHDPVQLGEWLAGGDAGQAGALISRLAVGHVIEVRGPDRRAGSAVQGR